MKDINPNYVPLESDASDAIEGLTAVGTSIIFGAVDSFTTTTPPLANLEPWVNDGTAANTVKIKGIAKGALNSNPQQFMPLVGP